MGSRLALAGTVAAVVATVLLLGGVTRESAPASASLSPPPSGSRGAVGGGGEPLVEIALTYQQRFRETADATWLSRSAEALRRARERDPGNVDVTSGLASLALARHDFRRALRLGRRALAREPFSARHRGVVGDALLELGRYREAFAAFERMVALKPDAASYARIAYARELLGGRRLAVDAMQLAATSAGPQGEPAAWSRVELGKLQFALGDLGAAERSYRAALAAFPGYVFALDALARLEGARGRLDRAVDLARRAVEAVPLPQFAATLADLYEAAGDPDRAAEQVRLVGAIERLLQAQGVRTDLETALFDVDRGLRLRDALARARHAHRERPSIEADDVLGWALVRNGRCGEGLRYAERSLRLGTRDALKLFHRGMAERCLGRTRAARRSFRAALALHPHFSIRWSPVARRYADR